MLQTKIGDVSPKGQILIPVAMRRAFGIKTDGKVYIMPQSHTGQIIIESIKKKDPIEAAFGMIADIDPDRSWTKELVEERRAEVARGK